MCYIKDTIPIFLITFSTGLIIVKLYLNEKKIYKVEKNVFILENRLDDLKDVFLKKIKKY